VNEGAGRRLGVPTDEGLACVLFFKALIFFYVASVYCVSLSFFTARRGRGLFMIIHLFHAWMGPFIVL
jgi:hypothetical protein